MFVLKPLSHTIITPHEARLDSFLLQNTLKNDTCPKLQIFERLRFWDNFCYCKVGCLGGQKVKEHEMQDLPTSHSILYFGPWKLMNLLRENFYYSFMLNDKWIGQKWALCEGMIQQFWRCHPNGVKMTIITPIRNFDWKSWKSCTGTACCQSSWSCRDTAKNLSEFPSFPGHHSTHLCRVENELNWPLNTYRAELKGRQIIQGRKLPKLLLSKNEGLKHFKLGNF